MFTAESLPWYEKVEISQEEKSYFKHLKKLKKEGKLEDLQVVKNIQARNFYLTLPKYFEILENWDYYEKEFNKCEKKEAAKKEWLKNRLGVNSFWAVKVARFICQNNLSEDPEKDLFCCLADNDILLYIEFLLAKDIYKGSFVLESPIKISDLEFLDPKFRVTRENTKEYFPEIEDFREIYHDAIEARRLRSTLSLLLSTGVSKKDKITILNYLVNKESNGVNNSFLNTKHPKIQTQRVWKSLLKQKNLLLLPKEIISLFSVTSLITLC